MDRHNTTNDGRSALYNSRIYIEIHGSACHYKKGSALFRLIWNQTKNWTKIRAPHIQSSWYLRCHHARACGSCHRGRCSTYKGTTSNPLYWELGLALPMVGPYGWEGLAVEIPVRLVVVFTYKYKPRGSFWGSLHCWLNSTIIVINFLYYSLVFCYFLL